MKIEIIKRTITHFSDVGCGECFIIHNYPYMKIAPCNFNDRDDSYINAVNLTTGSCSYIDKNTEVRKVCAKLVIDE